MKTKMFSVITIMLIFIFSGCAGNAVGHKNKYLPSSKEIVVFKWKTYDEAVANYNKIKEGMEEKELKGLGIYDGAANVKIENWLTVQQEVLHNDNIKKEDLDKGIQIFLDAKGPRKSYKIEINNRYDAREGSTLKDLVGFKKITRTTGFEFSGRILIVDCKVVYVFLPHEGQPVNKLKDETIPLGPLQDAVDPALDTFKKLYIDP